MSQPDPKAEIAEELNNNIRALLKVIQQSQRNADKALDLLKAIFPEKYDEQF